MEKIKIVLDTNWYISASISKKSRRTLYNMLINQRLLVFYCDEILKEYRTVIIRSKFKSVITERQSARFMNLVIPRLEYISIESNVVASRDVNDNFLLSLSVDCGADYLITGDVDLLILQTIGTTKIITLHNFLEIINA